MNAPDDDDFFADDARRESSDGPAAVTLDCPYCGETFDSSVDASPGDQTYVEDCAVCCRPIVVSITVDAHGALDAVRTRREND